MHLTMAPSTNSRVRLGYRPDIDGLRAFAVTVVVLFHIFPGRLTGGFVGVDIFFVISGYLITGIIYKAMLDDRFSIADFYARRIRRIFPALATVLLAVLAFGYLALFDDEYKQLGIHAFGGASFSSNFILAAEAGYFDNAAESKPLLHLWSLGVEEQFYILWPLLLWSSFRLRKSMRSMLWGVLLMSFVVNLTYVGQYPEHVFFWPFTRMWELCIGGIIAVTEQHRSATAVFSKRQANLLAWLGVGCLLAASFLFENDMAFPGAWALLPTIGAALTIYTASHGTLPSRILGERNVVFIGRISYPLYLWHWPVLVFTKHLIAEPLSITVKAAVIAASILLACLTYWLIESPFGNPGQQSSRQTVAILSILMATLGFAGVWVWKQNGLPQRGTEYQNPISGQRWPANTEHGYTRMPQAKALFAGQFIKDRDFFLMPSTPGRHLVAIIGDSHANRLAVGMGIADRNAERILNLGRGTCLPFYDTNSFSNGKSRQCQPLMNNIIDYVAASDNIETIIVTGYFNLYLNGGHGLSALPEAAFEAALEQTLRILVDAGKRVILVEDVPDFGFPISRCVARPFRLHSKNELCEISAKQHRSNSYTARRVITRLKERLPMLTVIDLDKLFCDDFTCFAKLGETVLYTGYGNHLNHLGARLIGDWIINQTASLYHLRAETLTGR